MLNSNSINREQRIQTAISSLLPFVQLMFPQIKGHSFITSEHHKILCDYLMGVLVGDIKRLIINMPPRAGKSLLVSQMFPAFALGLNPMCNFILNSYSKTLATQNAYMVREIMRNQVYKSLWLLGNGYSPSIRTDSDAKDYFRTTDGGTVYAVGTGGTITGFGAGAINSKHFSGALILDDTLNAAEASSDIVRNGVNDWFQTTLESRKNSPDTPIIIVSQRLHEGDLPGFLLGGGNGEKWSLLKIPAIKEDGSSFWPTQFPLDKLKVLEDANAYVFAGQYMQEPVPKVAGVFNTSQVKIWEGVLPVEATRVRAWDLAATTQGDYTVGILLAQTEGTVYIEDMVRFRGTPEHVEKAIIDTAKADGTAVSISLPLDPGAAGISVKHYLSKLLHGYVFEFTRESGSKETRATALASQINVGNVYMCKAGWNSTLLSELSMFPYGNHDDCVDALSRAYNHLIADTSMSPLFGTYG